MGVFWPETQHHLPTHGSTHPPFDLRPSVFMMEADGTMARHEAAMANSSVLA